MNNAVVMEIGDGGESGANEVCSVGFIVATFSAYPVEQFSTKGEISD